MKLNLRREINVPKAASYSIVINSVQILAVLALAAYVLLDGRVVLSGTAAAFAVCAAALLCCWGAAMDIREAGIARRVSRQRDALDETVGQMEDFNRALRAQRHDFLNHLQVVYSLMEMGDYAEASDYIEKVYGDIQELSAAMRTDSPAVNALLRVKLSQCEQAGVKAEAACAGSWKSAPIPAWELCRVLSNLIDNSLDALRSARDKRLRLTLREDIRGFTFTVENNGPVIPPERLASVFEAGVSTKGEGRGMGLYIARGTLAGYGGTLSAVSDEKRTAFTGFIPRGKDHDGKKDEA